MQSQMQGGASGACRWGDAGGGAGSIPASLSPAGQQQVWWGQVPSGRVKPLETVGLRLGWDPSAVPIPEGSSGKAIVFSFTHPTNAFISMPYLSFLPPNPFPLIFFTLFKLLLHRV